MNNFILFIFILLFFLLVISEFLLRKINNKYDGEIQIGDHSFKTNTVNNNPDVVYLTGFLSSNECKYLINQAQGKFKKSTTIGTPDSFGRTSYSCFLNKPENLSDNKINTIYKRIATYLNVDECQIEDLQVVRYYPGQKYDYHFDWFDNSNELKRGGQRLYTIFTYLNTLNEEGNNGSTCFKNLDICMKPIEGNAVFWTNLKNGMGDPDTLHAGVAPKNGIKYGLNIWIREKCFIRKCLI
jgi:prolyl 4-hydroxylase